MAELLMPDGDEERKEVSTGKVKKGLQWIVFIGAILTLFAMVFIKNTRNETSEKTLDESRDNASVSQNTPDKSLSVAEMTKQKIKTPEPSKTEPPKDIVDALRANSSQFKKESEANATPEQPKSLKDMKREALVKNNGIFVRAQGSASPQAKNNPNDMSDINKKIDEAMAASQKQLDDIANTPLPQEETGTPLPKTNVQLKTEWQSGQSSANMEHTPVGISPSPGRHVIYEGTNIPAVVSEVAHSDMPGKFSARIKSPVYDRRGNLIIPPASIVLGLANPDVSPGQTLMQAAFYRIILPNGKSIWLSGMQGSDAMGRSGIEGDVNNHFLRMFATSFAIAALQGIFVNNDNSTSVNGTTGTVNVITSSAGQTLSEVSREILQRNRSMAPTITLVPGQEFNIRVVKDIVGEPYKP